MVVVLSKEPGNDLVIGKLTSTKDGCPGVHAIDGEANVISCKEDLAEVTMVDWVVESSVEKCVKGFVLKCSICWMVICSMLKWVFVKWKQRLTFGGEASWPDSFFMVVAVNSIGVVIGTWCTAV